METNLKFSDIIRYILLGSLSLFIILQPIYIFLICINSDLVPEAEHAFWLILPSVLDNNTTYASVVLVILLAVSYLVGAAVQGYRLFLLQTIRRCYHYPRVRAFMEYCFGNPGKNMTRLTSLPHQELIRSVLRLFVIPSYFYDIYNYTRVLKFRKRGTQHIPNWIYISDEPQMTCEVIDKIVGKRGDDDHLYLSEFLTSMMAVTWSCMILLLPLLPFLFWRTLFTLLIFLLLLVGFCVAAKSFGEEYIRSLGMWFRAKLEEEHRIDEFGHIIALNGAPKVYLLVRTKSNKAFFLDKTLESIERQSYKNFQVIIIEDVPKTKSSDPSPYVGLPDDCIAQNVVERYNDRIKHPSLYNHITFCKLDCGNPATTMMREREFFLKMADRTDIAVILDDDDELRTDDALLNIVHAMTRNKANLCLTSFESKGDLGLDITNNGGGVHNQVIKQFSRESISEFDHRLCHASSIGWTKACSMETVAKYVTLLDKHAEKHPGNSYCDFEKYEDFPDFVMQLFTGTVITGVVEATHAYYKREGRITTTVNDRDFSFCRAKNLNLLIELVLTDGDAFPNAEQAMHHTLEFVLFKTCQIEDIYHKWEKNRKRPVFTFTDWLFKALSPESRLAFGVSTEKDFRRKVLEKLIKISTLEKDGSRIFKPTYISAEQMKEALRSED